MSSTEQGLSSVEAARRLAAHGPNEPAPIRRLSAVVQLFHLFANPLVIILLVASAIAGSLGQQVDALIIVTMVGLGVTINFWQSYRSHYEEKRTCRPKRSSTIEKRPSTLRTPQSCSGGREAAHSALRAEMA